MVDGFAALPVIDIVELLSVILIPIMHIVMSYLFQVSELFCEGREFQLVVKLLPTKSVFPIGEDDAHQFAVDVVVVETQLQAFGSECLVELLPVG